MTAVNGVTGRILVVEDDGDERSVLARSLRELGHVVAEAADADEALGWTSTWPPDVVLLDRALPDGSGLLARLKAHTDTRDVPVLVVTSTPDVTGALSGGAHDYLARPVHADELFARTQAALRTKALADELRHAAAQDPLTGLPNRRGALEQLRSWRAHCRRHGHPLAVVLVSIDGLAHITDEHGAAVADRVMRAVAEALSASVRVEDVVGRWGTDDLLVVLPRADAATAAALVERASARLAGQQLVPGRAVTLQGGVAVAARGSVEEDERLLGRAAVALHAQRSPGRQLA
jgi:diguanylate cyclase (GGDEF)-like protein